MNFILTLENWGPRVNDSWDSDPSENPVKTNDVFHWCGILHCNIMPYQSPILIGDQPPVYSTNGSSRS